MLVIFDCDGVLIDSEPIACGAVAAGLRQLGIEVSTEDVLSRYTGVSTRSMYADIEARYGVSVSAADQQVINNSVEERLAACVQAMPGIVCVLEELEQHHEICVASSSAPSRIEACLMRTALRGYFGAHVYSAHQVPRGKPAPDLFLFAAQSMERDPRDCVVIEDSPAGVQAALAAEMRCFGFVGGSHATLALADALHKKGASVVFDSMCSLTGLLDSLEP
jgi:HAD superfamily hydrolase (TIGR01509 family)